MAKISLAMKSAIINRHGKGEAQTAIAASFAISVESVDKILTEAKNIYRPIDGVRCIACGFKVIEVLKTNPRLCRMCHMKGASI